MRAHTHTYVQVEACGRCSDARLIDAGTQGRRDYYSTLSRDGTLALLQIDRDLEGQRSSQVCDWSVYTSTTGSQDSARGNIDSSLISMKSTHTIQPFRIWHVIRNYRRIRREVAKEEDWCLRVGQGESWTQPSTVATNCLKK